MLSRLRSLNDRRGLTGLQGELGEHLFADAHPLSFDRRSTARCQRTTGTGGSGSSSGRPWTTAACTRPRRSAQRCSRWCGDREQAARSESSEHRLGYSHGGVAAGEDAARAAGAGEQSQPASVENAVGLRPVCARDAVVGELGGDELVADSPDADRGAVARLVAEGADYIGGVLGEELLDGGPQGPREAERSINGRRVTARLDGRDQLAANPGPSGQLGLRQAAFQPTVT